MSGYNFSCIFSFLIYLFPKPKVLSFSLFFFRNKSWVENVWIQFFFLCEHRVSESAAEFYLHQERVCLDFITLVNVTTHLLFLPDLPSALQNVSFGCVFICCCFCFILLLLEGCKKIKTCQYMHVCVHESVCISISCKKVNMVLNVHRNHKAY